MTSLLLRKGLDPNIESAEWGTPLHCAVRTGKPDTVKALLDTGANPSARQVNISGRLRRLWKCRSHRSAGSARDHH
jgi:ankyrin repeat protein